MLKDKLYCKNNSQCYFGMSNLINNVSEKLGLDIIVKDITIDGNIEKTNCIVDKKNNDDVLYTSQNPLKIVDFLEGYKTCVARQTKN